MCPRLPGPLACVAGALPASCRAHALEFFSPFPFLAPATQASDVSKQILQQTIVRGQWTRDFDVGVISHEFYRLK